MLLVEISYICMAQALIPAQRALLKLEHLSSESNLHFNLRQIKDGDFSQSQVIEPGWCRKLLALLLLRVKPQVASLVMAHLDFPQFERSEMLLIRVREVLLIKYELPALIHVLEESPEVGPR